MAIDYHVKLTPDQEKEIRDAVGKFKQDLEYPSADQILRRAADLIEERGKNYDTPGGERSLGKTVAAFNIITGHELTEAEGWLLLQLLKDVRLWTAPTYHKDSAEDCVSYSALKAEAKSREG